MAIQAAGGLGPSLPEKRRGPGACSLRSDRGKELVLCCAGMQAGLSSPVQDMNRRLFKSGTEKESGLPGLALSRAGRRALRLRKRYEEEPVLLGEPAQERAWPGARTRTRLGVSTEPPPCRRLVLFAHLHSLRTWHRQKIGQGHVLAPDSESPPSLRRASAVPSAESLRRALRRVSGAQRGAGPVLCGAAPAQRQSGLAFRTPLRRVLRVSAALSAVFSAESRVHREERGPSSAAQRGREASPYAHSGIYSRPRTLDSASAP